jgi:2-iminobutanoate/2-iminopropanoate deaminase
MQKHINTDGAPKPIGPYSQAVNFRRLIFTSGQVALNEEGVIATDDVKEQTKIVIENLRNILKAGGSSLANVIKTIVFLKDMGDFAAMNEVYNDYFGKVLPARSTVEVARLPKDAKVEIEVIAFIN